MFTGIRYHAGRPSFFRLRRQLPGRADVPVRAKGPGTLDRSTSLLHTGAEISTAAEPRTHEGIHGNDEESRKDRHERSQQRAARLPSAHRRGQPRNGSLSPDDQGCGQRSTQQPGTITRRTGRHASQAPNLPSRLCGGPRSPDERLPAAATLFADGGVRLDGETGGASAGESGTLIDRHFGGVFVAAGDIEALGPFLFHAGYSGG